MGVIHSRAVAGGMIHAGVLSREVPSERLAQPEGRLVFATSDIATFWHTFIDGAIEFGVKAGRRVRHIVRNGESRATAQTLRRVGAKRSTAGPPTHCAL
jgi:hypothetical protein